MKKCLGCGRELNNPIQNHVFCSDECKNNYKKRMFKNVKGKIKCPDCGQPIEHGVTQSQGGWECVNEKCLVTNVSVNHSYIGLDKVTDFEVYVINRADAL